MSSLTEGRWIRVLYWGLKRPDEAQALLERAQGWWPDREWRRRLDAVRLELGALLEGFSGTLAGGDRGVAQQLLLHTAAQLEHMPLQAAQLYYEAMRAGAPVSHAQSRRCASAATPG